MKIFKILIITIFLFSHIGFVQKANANDTACGAILCLAGGAGYSECNPYLNAYYSITRKKLKDTLKARLNWLSLCPKQNGGWLRDVVYAGAQCTPEILNKARHKCGGFDRSSRFNSLTGRGCGLRGMPASCAAYFNKYPEYSYIETTPSTENCYRVRKNSQKNNGWGYQNSSFRVLNKFRLFTVDNNNDGWGSQNNGYITICPPRFSNKYKRSN